LPFRPSAAKRSAGARAAGRPLLALPFGREAGKGEPEGDSSRQSPHRARRTPNPDAGFTLIEVVIVITVLGIVGAVGLIAVNYTVEGYAAQTRRAALVDDTTVILSRMARDIRAALPNSVRVKSSGGRIAIEMIHVVKGARYRDGPGEHHHDPDDILQFNRPDSDFNVLLQPAPDVTLPSGERLVIYNVGVPDADAYQNANVITPATTQITLTPDKAGAGTADDETHVHLSAGFRFNYRSPAQRIYLVDGPVSWICDSNAQTLTRYSGYSIQYNQTTHLPMNDGALAADSVTGCNFTYHAGTSQRAGVATLRLKLTRGDESVHLIEQVHVVNAP
jgi:MSHA biogenesis protein MshO